MKTRATVRMGFLAGFVGADVYIPYDEYAPNGLIKAARGPGNSWLIMANVSHPALVTMEALEASPQDVEESEWDDIAEFSFDSTRPEDCGPVYLNGAGDFSPDDQIEFNQFGAGWYRVRVYARGRGTPGSRGEEFLVVSWPAPKEAPRTIKMTSAFAAEAAAEYDSGG